MTLTDIPGTPETEQPQERLTSVGADLRVALDGPYAFQRAGIRAAFPAEDLLRDPELDVEESRTWTTNRLLALTERGFGSTGVPEDSDAVSDPLAAVLTFETLAHGDLSVTIKSGVQFGLFGGAVTNLGTAYHHDTFLPRIVTMDLLGCFAMTEIGHGSDVQSLETTITYVPETEEFEVHSPTEAARKAYIGNAARDGRMAVVFGQLIVDGTGHGVHAILVPIRDEAGEDLPGVTTGDHGHKGGLLGVDNGTLLFDHVRVPRTMLLDRYGGVGENGVYSSPIESQNRRFFTMVGTLVRGRVCIASGGAITARRALSIATRYGLTRRQFPAPGRPDGVLLMDYLQHQRRLLPRLAKSYAIGYAQNELTKKLVHIQGGGEHTEDDQRDLEIRAAGLKAYATWFANDAVQEAREACGGAGYMSENQIVQMRQDVDIFATFEGDNTVLMQLVAKAQIMEFREAWKNLDRDEMRRATARMVGDTVIERTAANLLIDRLSDAARRRPDKVALWDRGWHAMMFEDREKHALESLVMRMRAAQKDGDAFEAMNAMGDHIQFVARAHVERTVLEAFIAGIDECEPGEAREVLERLCTLYALQSIHDDRGWFLEHNRITPDRSKAVGAQLDALCRELRPDALSIVEGLGIPKEWLHAAILED